MTTIFYDTQPLLKAAPSISGGIYYKEENKTEYIPHSEVIDFVLMSLAGWLNYFKIASKKVHGIDILET